ncbi:hypothetical protein ES703_41283 [subsurface metagenome]
MKKKQKNFEKFHSQLDLPFLETDNEFLEEIFQTLEFEFSLEYNSKQKFIDLGAGNGVVVIFVALNYSIKSYGFEINQNLINEAEIRIKSLKKEGNYLKSLFKKIFIKYGDLYQHDLKIYDFIYIYSLPTMQRYLKHVFNTAKKNAVIISFKYQLKNFKSILTLQKKLIHNKNKKEVSTFFYRKIS